MKRSVIWKVQSGMETTEVFILNRSLIVSVPRKNRLVPRVERSMKQKTIIIVPGRLCDVTDVCTKRSMCVVPAYSQVHGREQRIEVIVFLFRNILFV